MNCIEIPSLELRWSKGWKYIFFEERFSMEIFGESVRLFYEVTCALHWISETIILSKRKLLTTEDRQDTIVFFKWRWKCASLRIVSQIRFTLIYWNYIIDIQFISSDILNSSFVSGYLVRNATKGKIHFRKAN